MHDYYMEGNKAELEDCLEYLIFALSLLHLSKQFNLSNFQYSICESEVIMRTIWLLVLMRCYKLGSNAP